MIRSLALAGFLALGLAACAGGEKDTDETGETGDVIGDATAGATVFADNCATCHGEDGTSGSSGPDLSGRVPGMSDAEIMDTVVNGASGMPAFGSLSAQDVADVTAWLRGEFG